MPQATSLEPPLAATLAPPLRARMWRNWQIQSRCGQLSPLHPSRWREALTEEEQPIEWWRLLHVLLLLLELPRVPESAAPTSSRADSPRAGVTDDERDATLIKGVMNARKREALLSQVPRSEE